MSWWRRIVVLGRLSTAFVPASTRLSSFGCSNRLFTSMADDAWPVPVPPTTHVTMKREELKERVLVVGDIHGCLDEFQLLLSKANYDPSLCTLIVVGDLVNKGPRSVDTVRFVRQLGAICIRGNHDDSVLSYCLHTNAKPRKSSSEFIDDLTQEDIEWLKNLPYTISIPSMATLIVHAGVLPGVPLHSQTRENMVTIRNVEDVSNGDGAGPSWVGTAKAKHGRSWAEVYSENSFLTTDDGQPYHVYFGHDAKRGLQLHQHATGLDTGCCYGKHLTAISLPTREVVQVDALRMYVVPDGD